MISRAFHYSHFIIFIVSLIADGTIIFFSFRFGNILCVGNKSKRFNFILRNSLEIIHKVLSVLRVVEAMNEFQKAGDNSDDK